MRYIRNRIAGDPGCRQSSREAGGTGCQVGCRAGRRASGAPFFSYNGSMSPEARQTARIAIVLSRPSHPGNIGAAARAMKTMGFSDLRLVAPRRFPHPEADALASGALDVLQAARVF